MDRFVTRKRRHQQETDLENGLKKKADERSVAQLPKWKKIRADNLDLDYCRLLSEEESEILLRRCEEELDYNTGRVAQVQIFGKWIDIPRKQVAFGDPGLSYTFSGNTVPARPWLPFLENIRDRLIALTGHRFNFVLINRYKDGKDYMGEHKDDEKDLDLCAPIASLSLGQPRDFYFKHQDRRGKQKAATGTKDSQKNNDKSRKTKTERPKSETENPKSETKSMKNESKSPKSETENQRNETKSSKSETKSQKSKTENLKSETKSLKSETERLKGNAKSPKYSAKSQTCVVESPKSAKMNWESESASRETETERQEGVTNRNTDKVNLVLEAGSLLMMNYPTNLYWYHALPKRLRVLGTRINLTFRCMKKK